LAAGRLALERRGACLKSGIDFAIETTLAGSGVAALMKQAASRLPDWTRRVLSDLESLKAIEPDTG
jgi:hypothetical protein